MGNKQTPAQQSIQAYIKHLKTRKETLNLTGLKCMKYDNIIVTIDQWKKMSQKLLQIQYEYPKYNQRIKKIIQELKIFIENINSEELIKAFQNKQKLEEFLRLDNSEAYPCLNLSEHIQIDQCQLHVQSMIKSTRIKRRILNNINELKKQSKLKNLVEKEILQKDNFIMIIIKKYCQIVLQTFQQINMNELNQETIDHQQSLTFITKFQQKLLTDIYMKEIDPDITLKTIFSYEKIFLHYINFLKCTNSEELKAYEQMLDLKQNLTLSDLGAEQAFWLSEKKDPYSEVVLQLNFIQKQICPVRKFELIGKLKYTICKCLDEYYIQHPMKNQKQLQVDSDHFLIILIYTLIRQNQPTFFIHLKFILFTMSKEIEIDRGQNSWVFVSLIAAVTQIQVKDICRNNLQNCLETVIQSQFNLEGM
ncbi:unnamed protein product [Paramecium octaurelia]|uniref:VPS9 domain-containing protein n=1 Tax=Paramecium octaurelia TaxID=43137 RepID=A0A8S1TB81_PAROT|nr:unnamed protein product [Paramecium octaurelia]